MPPVSVVDVAIRALDPSGDAGRPSDGSARPANGWTPRRPVPAVREGDELVLCLAQPTIPGRGEIELKVTGTVLAGPRRAPVAQLYHPRGRWEDDSLVLTCSREEAAAPRLAMPKPGAVLEAALADRGVGLHTSTAGEQVSRLLALSADRTVLRRPEFGSLLNAIRRLPPGTTRPVTLDNLTTPDGPRGTATVLDLLVRSGLAERGLTTECTACGHEHFPVFAGVSRPRCRRCGEPAVYARSARGEPAFHYQLDPLVTAAARTRVPTLLAVAALLSGEGAHVELLPQLRVDGSGWAPVDLLGWMDGTVLAATVLPLTEPNRMRRTVEVCARAGVTLFVAASVEPIPPERVGSLSDQCRDAGLELTVLDGSELLLPPLVGPPRAAAEPEKSGKPAPDKTADKAAPEPAAEPSAVRRTPEPAAEQPTVRPAPEPVGEQTTVRPAPEPAGEQTTVRRAPQPAPEPVPEPAVRPAPPPAADLPTVRRTPQPAAEQPPPAQEVSPAWSSVQPSVRPSFAASSPRGQQVRPAPPFVQPPPTQPDSPPPASTSWFGGGDPQRRSRATELGGRQRPWASPAPENGRRNGYSTAPQAPRPQTDPRPGAPAGPPRAAQQPPQGPSQQPAPQASGQQAQQPTQRQGQPPAALPQAPPPRPGPPLGLPPGPAPSDLAEPPQPTYPPAPPLPALPPQESAPPPPAPPPPLELDPGELAAQQQAEQAPEYPPPPGPPYGAQPPMHQEAPYPFQPPVQQEARYPFQPPARQPSYPQAPAPPYPSPGYPAVPGSAAEAPPAPEAPSFVPSYPEAPLASPSEEQRVGPFPPRMEPARGPREMLGITPESGESTTGQSPADQPTAEPAAAPPWALGYGGPAAPPPAPYTGVPADVPSPPPDPRQINGRWEHPAGYPETGQGPRYDPAHALDETTTGTRPDVPREDNVIMLDVQDGPVGARVVER